MTGWDQEMLTKLHETVNDPFIRAASWFYRAAERLLGFEPHDPRLDAEARNLWPLPCRALDRIGDVLYDYGFKRRKGI